MYANGLNNLCDSSITYQEISLPWLNYIKEQRNHQEISDDDAEMMPIDSTAYRYDALRNCGRF